MCAVLPMMVQRLFNRSRDRSLVAAAIVALVLACCVLAKGLNDELGGDAILTHADIALTREGLAGALRNNDALIRGAAATAIGSHGFHELAPDLRRLFSDPVLGVQLDAARALVALGDGAGREWLRNHLDSTDPSVRVSAAAALCGESDDAARTLVTSATAHEAHVRTLAVKAMGRCTRISDRDELLAKALNDADVGVRVQAVLSISEIGEGVRRVALLIKALHSNDETVRYAANLQLMRLSGGHDVGFKASAVEAERSAAIARWESWWSKVTPERENTAR
jgi:hypothetical protein